MRPSMPLLLILTFGALSVGAAEQTGTAEAKLIAIQPRSQFTGPARATKQPDPRFVITFELSDSSLEGYSIHSPTRLFGNEPAVGWKYKIHRRLDVGRWLLTAEPLKQ